MAGCWRGVVTAFCGDNIDKEVNQQLRIKLLEQKLKEKEEETPSEAISDNFMSKVEELMSKERTDMEKKLKTVSEGYEEKLRAVGENYEEKLLAANTEIEKSNDILQEMLRTRSESDVNSQEVGNLEQKLSAQGQKIDMIKSIMETNDDEENFDHDVFEMERAYKEDWKLLETIKPLTDEEWKVDAEKNKKIQSQFFHPPLRKGKTFRAWQSSLYRWAVRMLKTRWSMEEVGHQVMEACFEGFPAASQIAEDNGPNLIAIMDEMIPEESPMIDFIESEMQRLLPLVRRRAGTTPMMWLTALKDIFNKEKQVLGDNCRSDKSRYNYIMNSIRLSAVNDSYIRGGFRPLARNNMVNIRTMLQKLKVTDTQVYNEKGHMIKNSMNEQDHMEELYGLFGASLKVTTDHTHTAEYNQYLSKATGISLYGQAPFCSEVTPGGVSLDQGTHIDLSGGGNGGNGGEEGLSLNSGGKKLTPEELQKMKDTPCPYGDKCFNLRTKGGCLRKHTGKEIARGLKEFEEKFPEAAAKKKAEREEKKKTAKAAADAAKAKADKEKGTS
eukprot:g16791.t1